MMGKTQKTMAALLLAFAGTAAQAAEAPMIVADAGNVAQPRFISLTSARNGTSGVRVVAPAMRSDRAAMNAGFMRLDRDRLQRVRQQTPMSARTAAVSMTPTRATPVIAPQRPATGDNAVLDLFGDTGNAPLETSRLGRVAHAWPLPNDAAQKFTSGFGTRKDPFHGRESFHGGIDLATSVGTSVLASADGVVSKVENGSRYGKYVSVQHKDGSESSYGHLSAQSVRVGQRVRQGQKLGEVGNTGRSTGPHLDYRLKKNGELVNPMSVLRQPSTMNTNVAFRETLRGTGGANTRHVSTINGVKIIR